MKQKQNQQINLLYNKKEMLGSAQLLKLLISREQSHLRTKGREEGWWKIDITPAVVRAGTITAVKVGSLGRWRRLHCLCFS